MLKMLIDFLVIGFIAIVLIAFVFADVMHEYCKKHVDCLEHSESEDD